MAEGARPKRSVEEIWRELNAPRPAVRAAAVTGIAGFGIPGVTTHTRILPKKTGGDGGGVRDATGAGGPSGGAGPTGASPSPPPAAVAVPVAPEAAGVAAADMHAYVSGMQRTINCLTDPDRSTRRGAIDAVAARLMRGDGAAPAATPQMLQAVLCGPLLQPLTAMLSDSVERCRCSALQLFLDAAAAVPDLTPLLPGLLGALVARCGGHPPAEPAEELRLVAAELTARVIQRAPDGALTAHAPQLAALLAAGLGDAYHEIKKAAAGALAALARRVPPKPWSPTRSGYWRR